MSKTLILNHLHEQKKVVLYISCTLDGYISKPNNDLSFLEKVQIEGEDYGYSKFSDATDVVIIGRKTYQWIIDQGYDYPHIEKDVYVITRTARPQEGNIKFYTGDLNILVEKLKSKGGKNIYCDGGAEIVNLLLANNLIDELIISIIPIMLGAGTKLFKDGIAEQDLNLLECKSYKSGLVQLHYEVVGNA